MSGSPRAQTQMVAQSDVITMVEVGGVPVLELPWGLSPNVIVDRQRALLRAINFLRGGCRAVQLVMLVGNSSDCMQFSKYEDDARAFVQSLEIREGDCAESLKCEFDKSNLMITMTRSVPSTK